MCSSDLEKVPAFLHPQIDALVRFAIRGKFLPVPLWLVDFPTPAPATPRIWLLTHFLTILAGGCLGSCGHLIILHLAVPVLDVPPPLALETILCVSIGVWLSRKRAAAAFWADFALWQPLVPQIV